MRTLVALCAFAVLLPLCAATPALAEDDARVFRYIAAPNWQSRAISFGTMCTADDTPTVPGESAGMPVVVGGVCSIVLAGASEVTIRVLDDVGAAVPAPVGPVAQPFRWELYTEDGVPSSCAMGGLAWDQTTLVVPPACQELSVFLSGVQTTGTITVVAR